MRTHPSRTAHAQARAKNARHTHARTHRSMHGSHTLAGAHWQSHHACVTRGGTTETMTRGIRRTSGHVAQAENFYPDNAIGHICTGTGLTPPTSAPGLGPLKGYSGTAPAKPQLINACERAIGAGLPVRMCHLRESPQRPAPARAPHARTRTHTHKRMHTHTHTHTHSDSHRRAPTAGAVGRGASL